MRQDGIMNWTELVKKKMLQLYRQMTLLLLAITYERKRDELASLLKIRFVIVISQ